MDDLRTERVVGTRPLLRDADELHPIGADPRVYEWVGEPLTLASTRGRLLRLMDHWKRHRFGEYVLRADGAVVGLAGPAVLADGDVELNWFLAADRWGEGLITEFMTAVVAHAFGGEPRLPSLMAKTLPDNARSRAVMERLGMTYERDIVHAGLPHVLYRLTNASS